MPKDSKDDPLYWLAFEPAAKKYALAFSTKTSWDAADPKLLTGDQHYYVPTACASCHGGDPRQGVLTFFRYRLVPGQGPPIGRFRRAGGQIPVEPALRLRKSFEFSEVSRRIRCVSPIESGDSGTK